jgi:hypothetical protein
VGRDGTVWINLRDRTDRLYWIVLDQSGDPIGSIVLGRAVTLHVADRTSIWVTEADQYDVESVVRYGIARD